MIKKIKPIFTVILCVLIMLSVFCSCKNEGTQQSETTTTGEPETTQSEASKKPNNVTLGYYSHYTLNPFTTKSKANKNLLTLVYDSLFKLDDSYVPTPSIAQSYENSGKTVSVTLKSSLSFSNGSPLSAQDVVYSFELAKKSPFWSKRLSAFTSALANGNEVVFSLKKADIYAVNCLDFPIVLEGTGKDSIPVGSGRYILTKKGKTYTLKTNSKYNLSEEMSVKTIKLLDINTTENDLYLLQIGELSFVYDDMSSDDKKEKINANTVNIALNNLVFLGINNESEVLSNYEIRQAIAAATDKKAIAAAVYDLLAKPCSTPFNPDWSEVSVFESEETSADSQKAEKLLDESGYVFEYKNNKFRSKNFEYLELNMIVSKKDARHKECATLIKKQLEDAGISVKLEKLEADEFKERLQSGEFDLYIGETKLTPNMDLSVFFSKNGAANYTIDAKSTCANAYYDLISGKIDMSTFVKVFDEYLPFIPVCYRYGTAYYSREIQYEVTGNENNMFAGIYSWDLGISK